MDGFDEDEKRHSRQVTFTIVLVLQKFVKRCILQKDRFRILLTPVNISHRAMSTDDDLGQFLCILCRQQSFFELRKNHRRAEAEKAKMLKDCQQRFPLRKRDQSLDILGIKRLERLCPTALRASNSVHDENANQAADTVQPATAFRCKVFNHWLRGLMHWRAVLKCPRCTTRSGNSVVAIRISVVLHCLNMCSSDHV